MTESIYKILNEEAQSWRYHRDLRKQGNCIEARKRERASILSHVPTLRDAVENKGWFTIGRGGWCLSYKPGCRLTHCFNRDTPAMMKCCIKLGLPVLDSREIDDAHIDYTVTMPMPGFAEDVDRVEEYNMLSYIDPLDWYKMHAMIGAVIHNVDGIEDFSWQYGGAEIYHSPRCQICSEAIAHTDDCWEGGSEVVIVRCNACHMKEVKRISRYGF